MTNKQPNVVIVLPDQMRGSAMGFLGEEPVRTPALDRFASQALCLDNAASNFPVCSPYRGMLMSGKYPYSSGVTGNCVVKPGRPNGVELKTNERCWSDILKDRGYSLGYIGKWHLDMPREPYIDCKNNGEKQCWNEWCPPERRHGFDNWYSYGTYDYHTNPMYWSNDAPRDGFHFVDQWGPEHEADRAVAYIRNVDGAHRDPDRPFALVVAHNPPHMPYNLVPQKYVDRYADVPDDVLFQRPNVPDAGTRWGDYYREHIRNQYGMITGVDEQFGRILAALDEQGLDENTIVVFTSDHGDCLGANDRQSKGNAYEDSMRVPFLIRWPGKIPVRRDGLLLSTPDIYPTLIELTGFADNIPADSEGTSYAKLFLGQEMERPDSQPYLRIREFEPGVGERGIRTDRYTAVWSRPVDTTTDTIVLFDRQEDPFQLTNIARQNPVLVSRLEERMNQWLEKTGDPWLDLDYTSTAEEAMNQGPSHLTTDVELLPTVTWGKHQITRLLLGHNPMKGGSHYSQALSDEMRTWHDQDPGRRIAGLKRAEAVGINTVQFGGHHMHFALGDYHAAGGTIQWIATCYGNNSGKLGFGEQMAFSDEVAELCAMNPQPIGIQHFGELTDQMYVDGRMEDVRDNLRRIRDTGLLVGLCTHLPEVVELAESQAWDVDFYQTSFYTVYSSVRLGRVDRDEEQFLESDMERMVATIKAVSKPCIAFKILGANRKCGSPEAVRRALQFAFDSVKETDVVLVGMWQKHLDQIGMNATWAREILADRAAAGASLG